MRSGVGADRSIVKPPKPPQGCTCNCRADADDNMLGNVRLELPLFRLCGGHGH
jgi:hypothetical protein